MSAPHGGMALRSGTVTGGHGLSPEAREQFETGARLLFLRWTALCLAVENQWGGASSAEKADWLLRESISWCYKNKVILCSEHYADDLEEELLDALLEDFNLEVEDGSALEIAQRLLKLFAECKVGSYSMVQELTAAAASGVARSRRQVVDNDGTVMGEADAGETSSSGSSDDDDDEMADAAHTGPAAPAARPAPVVDEDGFTMVQGRGRKGASAAGSRQ
ncbi:uncharacterized protein HaLaN_03768 [Haematococcus lacustris]|uniref:Pre-rRNA-processing protein TSR2 n=1 Tax=Haematococcus lacustris TaxID=44745 RepID=A0A699YF27_HAELA|nr:uncharacterized protein HaLaN_03768 [Haematococcus lacustris]